MTILTRSKKHIHQRLRSYAVTVLGMKISSTNFPVVLKRVCCRPFQRVPSLALISHVHMHTWHMHIHIHTLVSEGCNKYLFHSHVYSHPRAHTQSLGIFIHKLIRGVDLPTAIHHAVTLSSAWHTLATELQE